MIDWLPELDDDDLTVLFEAVEAWEHKDFAGDIMTDMLDAVTTDPRARGTLAQARRADQPKREAQRTQRKERGVFLRAKLLMLRNRRRVEATFAAIKDP